MRHLVAGLVEGLAGVIYNNKIQFVKTYKQISCYFIPNILRHFMRQEVFMRIEVSIFLLQLLIISSMFLSILCQYIVDLTFVLSSRYLGSQCVGFVSFLL